MAELARPGVVGRAVRLLFAAILAVLTYQLAAGAPSWWDGLDGDAGLFVWLAFLLAFSHWLVNELLGVSWGWRPTAALVAGAGVAAAVGAWTEGTPWGAPLGIYLWAWSFAFALTLGLGHLLAVLLGTPGCELRSFWHLWAKVRGRDVAAVACPGWVDRFDRVRIAGRW